MFLVSVMAGVCLHLDVGVVTPRVKAGDVPLDIEKLKEVMDDVNFAGGDEVNKFRLAARKLYLGPAIRAMEQEKKRRYERLVLEGEPMVGIHILVNFTHV